MPDRLSRPSRREARRVTAGCALVAGLSFASAVSPSVETVAGWVCVAVIAAAGLWLAGLGVRSVWLSLSIDHECARSLRDNERAVREVHRA
jgi:hypothetical protein